MVRSSTQRHESNRATSFVSSFVLPVSRQESWLAGGRLLMVYAVPAAHDPVRPLEKIVEGVALTIGLELDEGEPFYRATTSPSYGLDAPSLLLFTACTCNTHKWSPAIQRPRPASLQQRHREPAILLDGWLAGELATGSLLPARSGQPCCSGRLACQVAAQNLCHRPAGSGGAAHTCARDRALVVAVAVKRTAAASCAADARQRDDGDHQHKY